MVPLTASELAARAGIDARYAWEWLEHGRSDGARDVDDVDAAPDARRYTLAAGQAEVLRDPDSTALLAPLTRFMVGSAQRMPEILEAYRTGAGIDWADYGPDVIEAQEAVNRPHFRRHVGRGSTTCPTSLSGCGPLADGLRTSPAARAGPRSRSPSSSRSLSVDGIDVDPGSIERARANAEEEGMGDRDPVRRQDASDAAAEGDGHTTS